MITKFICEVVLKIEKRMSFKCAWSGLLFSLTVYLCESKIKTENTTNINGLSEQFNNYIIEITKAMSDVENQVHFIFPTGDKDTKMAQMVEKTLQNLSSFRTVTINDSFCCDTLGTWHIPYQNKFLKFTQHVFIIPIFAEKKIEYFESQLAIIAREDSFNPKALFILVQLTNKCGQVDTNVVQNKRVFNNLWEINIFNATLVIISCCDLALTVVTAKPFSQDNRCREIEDSGFRYYYLPLGKAVNYNLFLNEELKNLQGCTFWAGTIPYPPYIVADAYIQGNETKLINARGIDIGVLQAMSEKANFTVKFYKAHTFGLDAWVTVFKNGTIIGFVQDLLHHKVDIIFGAVIPSYVTVYKIDYSSTYKFSTLNFFVPDAEIIPLWLIFLKVFSARVWLISGGIFLLVSVVYHFMDFQTLKNIDESLLELFKLSIGFSSVLNPRKSHMRVLLFTWAVYCLHWYIAYTTMMFILLTVPPHNKDISTFEDLRDSGFKVKMNAIYLELFGHTEVDKTTTSVLQNNIICPDMEVCVHQFVKHRNFSILIPADTLQYLINWQRSKIHILPENILTYSVSFLTNKGNPLCEVVNSAIRHTLQAGLLTKWERDASWNYHLKNTAHETEEKAIILDLKGAFYILFIGYIIGFLIFVVEIIINYLKKP